MVRKEKNLSQADVAVMVSLRGLRCSAALVSAWESGSRPISVNEAAVVADSLDARITDLVVIGGAR